MNARTICQFIVFPVLAAMVLFACSKDLGNYDYDPANVITVSTDMSNVDPQVVINNDSIVVKQNDSLKVNILLSQTKPSSDLSFEWLITQNIAQIGNPTQHVVGNAQNLRTKILLSPNLYRLVVRVTDKATGVSFYKFYSLNVNTAPWGGEGWVVLQDQASQTDISVITTRDGAVRGTIYSNVYSLTNGSKLPAATNKVNVINYATALRSQKVSFLYPGGGLQVRSTDFSDSSVHTSWFLVTPPSFNMQLNAQANTGQYEYLINNNQLHYRRVNASTLQAPPIKFGAPVLGTWTLAPFMMNNLGSEQFFTLYDQANKCFLLYNGETGVLTPTNRPDVANSHFVPYVGGAAALHPTTGSGFDLNNIGRNLIHTENSQPLAGGTKPIYNCTFALGLAGRLRLHDSELGIAPLGLAVRGRGLIPTLDARGGFELGDALALQLDGDIAQWPESWPALPSPVGQSTSSLPFQLMYRGQADLSAVTSLQLHRDGTAFDGRFRLPQMLDWIDAGAQGSPLPPLDGLLASPRIEIAGAVLEGVEVQFGDDATTSP